ncbi:ribonuclease III domain-containing protein [Phlyctochytrium arcticum]|nr:ribonuclease III domain-containing protein [Phlyctochytrium arcticum]
MRPTMFCPRAPLLRISSRSRPLSQNIFRTIHHQAKPLSVQEQAQLTAFGARTGFEFSDNTLLANALTHKSYPIGPDPTYDRLQFLGEKVLGLYVTEYIHIKYPKLPAESVDSVLQAFVGSKALANIGQHFGISTVMRWKGTVIPKTPGEASVAGKVFQALIGALYQDKGPRATRQFIQKYILSRSVDMEEHLKLNNPKGLLVSITKSLGLARPVSRLIKETGRLSSSPVFIVGIYSGTDILGEGYGSSLRMAETRAVRDALHKHYLREIKDIKLPSDLEEESITFFEEEAGAQ